jgi:hypothetical protein
VAVNRKSDNRIIESEISRRGSVYLGSAPAGKVAIILLLFLFSGPVAAQPQAKITPNPQSVPLSRSINVTLELTWAGEADVYDIPQPDVSALKEFQILERSLSTERRGDENVLRHKLVMQPLEEGEYDLGRMSVQYFEKDKDVPVSLPLPETLVEVTPREIIPRGIRNGIIIGLLGAGVGIGISLAAQRKKRLRQKKLGSALAADRMREEFSTKLADAVTLRIEGDLGAYLEGLCALADSAELRPHIEKLEELSELAENVKFGGLAPSPDQLSWAEKLIKSAVKKAFPVDDEAPE